MNFPLLAAGLLTLATVAAHVIGGTPEFMAPIHASNAPDFNKTGMTVIWHWVTAAMSINAAALFWAMKRPLAAPSLVALVVAQFLAFGVLFMGYGLSAFDSLLPMPQWAAFFLIAALALWGLRTNQRKSIA